VILWRDDTTAEMTYKEDVEADLFPTLGILLSQAAEWCGRIRVA
jgi:hypothetical protein